MTDTSALQPAFAALDDCDVALAKLDKMCCDPGRSPRMQHLGTTLAAARSAVEEISGGLRDSAGALEHLEDAGGQLGSLQVGCCAPSRMPLYARMLEDLTTIQLAINQAQGTGH